MSEAALNTANEAESESNARKTMRSLFWGALFFFSLLFFTVFKLPDTRIKGHLNALISKTLMQAGYSFSANESSLSIGLGIHYTLKGVTISPRFQPQSMVKIDSIEISPSLLSLLTGKISASLAAEAGKGVLTGEFGVRGSQGTLSCEFKQVNLAQSPLALLLQGVQVSSTINGTVNLEGNLQDPRSLLGTVDLTLSKIDLDKQAISGFPVPRTQISGAKINLLFNQGKIVLKNLTLGSMQNPGDDLAGKIEGDIQIQQRLEASGLNLMAHFNVAPNYLQNSEIFLVQSFIAPGKNADGSYRFKIYGPLSGPSADPIVK